MSDESAKRGESNSRGPVPAALFIWALVGLVGGALTVYMILTSGGALGGSAGIILLSLGFGGLIYVVRAHREGVELRIAKRSGLIAGLLAATLLVVLVIVLPAVT